jgi:L-gulonolactone oxidase
LTGYVADDRIVSWGRVHRYAHQVARPSFADELTDLIRANRRGNRPVLGIGYGRSYGDSGLNQDAALIDMTRLDRLISFDPATGLLHAEAGMSLAQVIAFALPRGFFLPVTPGTRFVSLAGAVANDVHGKNHHKFGTFGRWVRRIGLLRSDGTRLELTPDERSGLFAATIGGLGLTGLITDVALELRPVPSAWLDTDTTAFGNLDEFFSLEATKTGGNEYSVAWIDCLARGAALGRGLFTTANHAADNGLVARERSKGPTFPVDLPGFALNRLSIGAFNALYYGIGRMNAGRRRQTFGPFFYPLDRIGRWNRMYGKRGMYQFQSVVPPEAANDATAAMLKAISAAGQGSFLVVLKTFGSLPSPGLLSFPMAGTTLALDFPNRGEATMRLLDRLDAIVREARGRLYPAKDGRFPPAMFRDGYPALERFRPHVDPAFSSSFWRRMEQQ